MVLGRQAILNEVYKGNIYIDPFDSDLVNGASVDIRLGHWIIRQQKMFGGLDTRSVDTGFMKPEYYELGQPILLTPGEFALASTLEEAGTTVTDIQWHIKARSTTGRWGVDICRCAGAGDPGFATHITMELRNNRNAPVILYVGDRVAQLEFLRVEGNDKLYSNHYGGKGDLWRPELMLPKQIDSRK